MLTQNGQSELDKIKARIKPGPVTAETTDDEINARVYIAGYTAGTHQQTTAHLLKLERRICQLEAHIVVAPHLPNVECRDH
jgi:hypothetical protein